MKEHAGLHIAVAAHERMVKMPNSNGWQDRHWEAWNGINSNPQETVMRMMIKGWLEYAQTHHKRFESRIGDDGVLGLEWQAIGNALRGLLNGECGRFDCGTLDAIINDALHAEGLGEQ